MSVIACQFLGRLGNTLFQYAFARAFAELRGLTLQTDPWVGQKIFEINDPPIDHNYPVVDEFTINLNSKDVTFRSYAQQDDCLIYTREQARKWFTFRPEIVSELKATLPTYDFVVGHRRVGDYAGYGYPVVSLKSYQDQCEKLGHQRDYLRMVTEETAFHHPKFQGEMACVPDFFRLTQPPVLLRGNSSFSWWAAVLSDARVYSPVIEGKVGGVEHDCEFVEGNWPRMANLHFTTDLHLK